MTDIIIKKMGGKDGLRRAKTKFKLSVLGAAIRTLHGQVCDEHKAVSAMRVQIFDALLSDIRWTEAYWDAWGGWEHLRSQMEARR